MDITKAVKHWQMDPRTNQGLSLEFLEEGTIKQIYPTKLGFNGNVSLSETFMVVFFNSLTDNVRRNHIKRDTTQVSELTYNFDLRILEFYVDPYPKY